MKITTLTLLGGFTLALGLGGCKVGSLSDLYASAKTAISGDASSGGSVGEDGEDVDCEDGINTATGEECDGGPAANQDDGDEEEGSEEADTGVDCVDGINSATGEECDGGPAANQDDGDEEDGDEADDEDGDDTGDTDDVECEDGFTPNGQPCDDED